MKDIRSNKGITNMTLITIVLVIIILMLLVVVIYLVKNPNTTYITQNLPTEQSQLSSTVTENEKETIKENIQVSNNSKTNTIEVENQYEKIKGTYEYITENYPGHEGIYVCFRLSLKEDGTFNYLTSVDYHNGFCGNYIINGSEIILNKLLNYGSDVSMSVVNEQVKLKINEDGSISDLNNYEELRINGVALNKKSNEIEKTETLKAYINIGAKNNSILYEGYEFSE